MLTFQRQGVNLYLTQESKNEYSKVILNTKTRLKGDGKMVLNKPIGKWMEEYPLLVPMTSLKECFWENGGRQPFDNAGQHTEIKMEDILDAQARLERFAPYLEEVFPETRAARGIIESPLVGAPHMQAFLSSRMSRPVEGRLMIKCDSHLPISGSIKARGGIYEVLKFAEEVALGSGMLKESDNYSVLAKERFRRLFSEYSVSVGSTGNLGLSIGIMSAQLGFQVTVHMSADARQWKKDMLRSKGVTVKEYDDDYSQAVTQGRKQASDNPRCHFVDDENSRTLFLGYTVAALRLKKQLDDMGIYPDSRHPLFVYLPCGVGGGPGGVAFGLKQIYGDFVHCFFAEPTHAPCMMLGLMTGCHDQVSVQDFGIDNKTAADGLAVGRASHFVGRVMEPFLSGCYTVSDEHLYELLAALADTESLELEPSALAGTAGPGWICGTSEGEDYIQRNGLGGVMGHAVHIAWATGGSMVPQAVMKSYYEKGKSLSGKKDAVQIG